MNILTLVLCSLSVFLLQVLLLLLTWAVSQWKSLGYTPADTVAIMFCSTHKSLTLGKVKVAIDIDTIICIFDVTYYKKPQLNVITHQNQVLDSVIQKLFGCPQQPTLKSQKWQMDIFIILITLH